ncbi:MAG: hypothetical protein SOT14_00290 [Succinivibrio sp.]|nr:hypothetical protein [Succinivibrio sp.]
MNTVIWLIFEAQTRSKAWEKPRKGLRPAAHLQEKWRDRKTCHLTEAFAGILSGFRAIAFPNSAPQAA